MFGYVRARNDTLFPDAAQKYKAVYCGLCHTLGKQYGVVSKLFLNYDFAFLAMLLAPSEGSNDYGCCRCPLHPVKGRICCDGGEWLTRAAGESVILTYWKLRDTLKDEGFFSRLSAYVLSLGLRRGYRKACTDYPDFNMAAAHLLEELRSLEVAGCTSIDQTADKFAELLCAAVSEEDRERKRVLRQLLYHVGRWIYLIDAVDDLSEDQKAGRYNPVLARFPAWTEEDKTYLRVIMDHSLDLAASAFQLLRPNPWSQVIENILYSGLSSIEELVFDGKWREYQKNHRRNDL